LAEALDWLGRFLAPHRLLEPVYKAVFQRDMRNAPNVPLDGHFDANDQVLQEDHAIRRALHFFQERDRGAHAKTVTSWISTSAFADTILVTAFNVIMDELVRAVLDMSGSAWEKRQRMQQANTGSREYRATNMAKGTVARTAFISIGRRAAAEDNTDQYWEAYCKEVGKLEDSAMQVFLIASRAAGSLFLRVIVRNARWPMKLFRLVLEGCEDDMEWDVLVAAFFEEAGCVLGLVGRFFREKFPTEELVQGEECRGHILALALIALISMGVVEVSHAHNQRAIQCVGRMGRAPALTRTAGIMEVKNTLREYEWFMKLAPPPPPPPANPVQAEQSPDPPAAEEDAEKPKRWSWPWRAHCSKTDLSGSDRAGYLEKVQPLSLSLVCSNLLFGVSDAGGGGARVWPWPCGHPRTP
jgi:hypothetical protein